MVDWSEAFGGIPILIHEANRPYVMRPSDSIRFFTEDRIDLGQGITVTRCGGHFAGSAVLHWPALDGKGLLMTGDTMMVVPDTRWVSFMYSYPNLIPLPAREVERIVGAVGDLDYDRIYSNPVDRVLRGDGKARVRASADRYIRAIS
jgi:glyoxylase-like metal-dependent hydrolase (beta-lactamase superfamily II)